MPIVLASPSSAAETGSGDAVDEPASEAQEQQDHRQQHDQPCGAEQGVVLTETLLEGEQRRGHRHRVRGLDEGDGKQELVIGGQSGNQSDREKTGRGDRQNDPGQDVQLRRTVDPGCFLELRWQRHQKRAQ